MVYRTVDSIALIMERERAARRAPYSRSWMAELRPRSGYVATYADLKTYEELCPKVKPEQLAEDIWDMI